MTLIEKFEPYVIRYTQDDVVGYLESDNVPILEYQEQCEKIAEEFAIGFLKWYVQEYSENEIEYLLEEHKKEKGL